MTDKKKNILDLMADLSLIDPVAEAAKKREQNLIDLGYNQALLDHGIPDDLGLTRIQVQGIVDRLRKELGT